MHYDYGALRFSVVRGLVISGTVVLLFVIVFGGVHAHLNGGALADGVKHVARSVGALYQQYPTGALAFHALLFLRGVAYRRRYANWGAQFVFIAALCFALQVGYTHYVKPSAPALAAPGRRGIEGGDLLASVGRLLAPPGSSDVERPCCDAQVEEPREPPTPNRLAAIGEAIPAAVPVTRSGDGALHLDAAVGARRVHFLLDPTSQITTLPAAFYQDSGVSHCVKVTVRASFGDSPGCSGELPMMVLGQTVLRSVEVTFVDGRPEMPAYLGQNVLQRFRMEQTPGGFRLLPKP